MEPSGDSARRWLHIGFDEDESTRKHEVLCKPHSFWHCWTTCNRALYFDNLLEIRAELEFKFIRSDTAKSCQRNTQR